MKTKQTRTFEENQAGEWKCPYCQEFTVCACVGFTDERTPIIRCIQCGGSFEKGRGGMMQEAKRGEPS